MTNKVAIDVEAKGAKAAAKDVKNVQSAWETFQKKGTQGLAIGAGLAVATKGFGLLDSAMSTSIDFMSDSIEKASDLNETISKADVIFGDNADAVEKWAGTMDRAAGQSKKAALDAASGFAGLFKTVGLGIDESTDKAEKLTQLGSDLASFFNTDVDEALAALKSGLNGESEPLRKFNVFLSETAVQAELTRLGVKKVGGQFTEAQKATARYNLILQQTGDAQGDFARTSDGLANSQRVTAAEIDNLQAEIGQELLPVVRDLSNWAKDEGVPALKDLIGVVKELAPLIGAIPDAVARDQQDMQSGLDKVRDAFHTTKDEATDLADTIPEVTKEVHRLGDATSTTAGETRTATGATEGLTASTSDLRSEVRSATRAFRPYKDALDDATDSLVEEKFAAGRAERAIKEHKLQLKDDIDELHKLEKIKNPTREQRLDILRTKDAVADDKEEVIRAAVELRKMGKITYGQLIGQLKAVHYNIMADTDAARALRLALYQADIVTGGGAGHGGGGGPAGGHHAAGGSIGAGSWGYVGEQGMEIARARAGGGVDIIPLNGSSGGGMGGVGGPIVVQVVLDGRVVAEATAPHVTKWQQDRRVYR